MRTALLCNNDRPGPLSEPRLAGFSFAVEENFAVQVSMLLR